MRLLTFLCCDAGIQDVRSNAVSLINVIEELASVSFPIIIPRLTAFGYFERDADEPSLGQCRLRARMHDQQIVDMEMAIDFQGKNRSRVIAELQGFPIMTPGTLRFSIHALPGQEELGNWSIVISSMGVPQASLFTGPTGPAGPAPDSG